MPIARAAPAGLDSGRRRPLDRGRRTSTTPSRALGDSAAPRVPALGRQELAPFAAAPQHVYLDPQRRSGRAAARRAARDLHRRRAGRSPRPTSARCCEQHRIEIVVAKNSGGDATYGKIAAARALGIDGHHAARGRRCPRSPTVDDGRGGARLARSCQRASDRPRRVDQRASPRRARSAASRASRR